MTEITCTTHSNWDFLAKGWKMTVNRGIGISQTVSFVFFNTIECIHPRVARLGERVYFYIGSLLRDIQNADLREANQSLREENRRLKAKIIDLRKNELPLNQRDERNNRLREEDIRLQLEVDKEKIRLETFKDLTNESEKKIASCSQRIEEIQCSYQVEEPVDQEKMKKQFRIAGSVALLVFLSPLLVAIKMVGPLEQQPQKEEPLKLEASTPT
jgi:hypothetical protein